MGIFSSIFQSNSASNSEKTAPIHWIPLVTIEQLNEIKEISNNETVILFKHSTRCGISRMVLKQFESQFDASMSNLKLYYLDLLNYRDISNEIAASFQVQHQSPQLLVVQNGTVVAHASHDAITSIDLTKYLDS